MKKFLQRNTWLKEYSLCFVIGIGVFILMLLLRQSTAIWGLDGLLMKHTTVNYAKYFWSNLLQGNLVSMDLMIGEGGNPIHYMTYYGLMEPWNILYVITPASWSIWIQGVLLVLRLFLSGCAFAWYAKRHTENQQAISVGAIVYVFSGFFIFWMQAPTLLSAGYLFPLLIGYLENAIQKHSRLPLILLTAFAYITNYYIAAVMSFMLLIYGLVYLTTNRLWLHWKQWVPAVFAHAIGILISSFIVLPCAWAILNGVRTNGHTGYDNWVVFPYQYYIDLIRHFFAPLSNVTLFWHHPYQAQNSYLLIALPAVITLLTTKEKCEKVKRLRYLLLIGLIMLAVPAFGRIFNGNSYTTHRWTFALSMLIAMTTVWALPRIQITKRMSGIIWAYIILSSALGFLLTIPNTAWCMVLAVAIPGALLTIVPLKTSLKSLMRISVMFTVSATMLFGQYIGNFITYPHIQNMDYYAHLQYETSFNERAAQSSNFAGVNTGMLHNVYTNQTAWNILLSAEGEYYHYAQLMPDMLHPSWPGSTDARSSIQLLSGVKYYISSDENKDIVPVGFKYLYTTEVSDELTLHIYENTLHCGIGYIFYDTMSTESFNNLDIASKQSALLNYAIIPDGEHQDVNNILQIPSTHTTNDDLARYTLQVPEGYELYMHIDSAMSTNDSKWELTPERLLTTSDKLTVNITVTDDDSSFEKAAMGYQPNTYLNALHATRTLCLGHQLSGNVTVTIEHVKGYTEGVRFYAIPIADITNAAETLTQNTWNNVQYDRQQECISGTVTLKQEGVFQLAVPYSEGWTVYVDGTEAELLQCGIKYMGVHLSPGEHTVKFKYEMPWGNIGMLITIIAIAITITIAICESIYRKRSATCVQTLNSVS